MSFSSDIKNEISRLKEDRKCCMLSEIAGFIRISGRVGLVGLGKFKIVVTVENPAIARHFKSMIKEYFNVDTKIHVEEKNLLNKNKLYNLVINPEDRSEEILRETGILMIKEGMNFISDGIYKELIKKKCCKKAYLRGLFLASGVITDPDRSYHFEISTNTEILAKDIAKLLNSFHDIFAKIIKRRNEYVVYIKDSEQIIDIMAIMGVVNQLFVFEDAKIRKEIKNKANRINNCDQANIDKSVKAAERHIENIKKIEKQLGIDKLPLKLREIAELRILNPHISLSELGELLKPPLKKSGVNKRLAKIEEIANNL